MTVDPASFVLGTASGLTVAALVATARSLVRRLRRPRFEAWMEPVEPNRGFGPNAFAVWVTNRGREPARRPILRLEVAAHLRPEPRAGLHEWRRVLDEADGWVVFEVDRADPARPYLPGERYEVAIFSSCRPDEGTCKLHIAAENMRSGEALVLASREMDRSSK